MFLPEEPGSDTPNGLSHECVKNCMVLLLEWRKDAQSRSIYWWLMLQHFSSIRAYTISEAFVEIGQREANFNLWNLLGEKEGTRDEA